MMGALVAGMVRDEEGDDWCEAGGNERKVRREK